MPISSIEALLRSNRTVFRTQDLAVIWNISDSDYLKTKIYRLHSTGKLISLRRGVYVLSNEYNPWELANKLCTPSYVSLHTVLARAGAVFQYDSAVQSVGRVSREVAVSGRRYVFRALKAAAFYSRQGLIVEPHVTYATAERALLDLLYLNPTATVDHVGVFDQAKIVELLPLYGNKKLIHRIAQLYA